MCLDFQTFEREMIKLDKKDNMLNILYNIKWREMSENNSSNDTFVRFFFYRKLLKRLSSRNYFSLNSGC